MKPFVRCSFFLLAALGLPVGVQASALDDFTRITNSAIAGHNREFVFGTPQDCADACVRSDRASWCKSFDYYKHDRGGCDLSDKRDRDVGGLKTNYPGNPFDHYVLKSDPLAAYARLSNAAIPGHNIEQLQNVTPEDCAVACSEPSRTWCRSFDYYKDSHKCDLSDKRGSDVGGLKVDYSGNPYDHYYLVANEGVVNPIPGKKHILLIGLDGLRGDALFCKGCANTPALRALAEGGLQHRNVLAGGRQATVSGPGWASVFTGFWASEHGVFGNETKWRMAQPHVFDLIKRKYPTATVAIVGDWYNITHNLKPERADFVVANGDRNSQQATDMVKYWLSWKNPPTAIFYYLQNIDIHASSYAPLNAYYQSKIRDEDQQIQQVLDALATRPGYADEEWLIVVTSDHGGQNSGHGGQSAGERSTILILNNSYQNPTKLPYCTGDLTFMAAMRQIDVAPHILDFLDLPNTTIGRDYFACGGWAPSYPE